MTAADGLVNRRVTQTRFDIIDTAVSLFLDQGFDDTSMTEIADAAGVSRRTLYRYFPAKEDIIFESPREWLAQFDEVVATREVHESTRDLFLRALVAVGDYIQQRRGRVVREFTVLASSPSLRARHGRSDAEWVDRYLEILRPDVEGVEDGELVATVCAMVLVAAQNAMISVWATGPEDEDMTRLALVALDRVDTVWPERSR